MEYKKLLTTDISSTELFRTSQTLVRRSSRWVKSAVLGAGACSIGLLAACGQENPADIVRIPSPEAISKKTVNLSEREAQQENALREAIQTTYDFVDVDPETSQMLQRLSSTPNLYRPQYHVYLNSKVEGEPDLTHTAVAIYPFPDSTRPEQIVDRPMINVFFFKNSRGEVVKRTMRVRTVDGAIIDQEVRWASPVSAGTLENEVNKIVKRDRPAFWQSVQNEFDPGMVEYIEGSSPPSEGVNLSKDFDYSVEGMLEISETNEDRYKGGKPSHRQPYTPPSSINDV